MKITRRQLKHVLNEYFQVHFPKHKSPREKADLIEDMFSLLTTSRERGPGKTRRRLDHEKTLSAARDAAPSSDLITPIESLYQNIGMVLPYIEDLKARHMRMTNKHRRHQNLEMPHVQRALDTLRALILVLEDYVEDMRDQIDSLVATDHSGPSTHELDVHRAPEGLDTMDPHEAYGLGYYKGKDKDACDHPNWSPACVKNTEY